MSQDFASLKEFYPYYLSLHKKRGTRLMHAIGLSMALVCVGAFFAIWNPWLILMGIVLGYVPAWLSHFLIEKNRPATFAYPFYSIVSDFMMYKDILDGGLAFDEKK